MSLLGQLKSLLADINRANNPKEEAECVQAMAAWLVERTEWKQIATAERRQDLRTLEHYAAYARNLNIKTKAAEFIENVRRGILHTHGGGVIHNPDPEAANV